ncbi:hypothetical protein [Actinomadura sp. B10D3]|uniref:hypothetical protein n=1 Tax=Actinomadura sp. B10D3 TaxID=3153557 RepID=UPI00325C9854
MVGADRAGAGVARTTVHRRFATREALIDALTRWAAERFAAAVAAARADTALTSLVVDTLSRGIATETPVPL